MRFFSLALAMLLASTAVAQNVGIGTTNPVRGKLVVDGVAGAGATNAIFGSMEAGISLQQNWPTIGFNYYRDIITPGSAGKFMKTGYGALMSLSQDNGILYVDLFGQGAGGANPFVGIIGWAVTPTGRMGVGHAAPGAALDVVRGTAPEGTAAFRGTQFNSHFNFSFTEDTYIRAGKSSAKLILNDIPGGYTGVGDAATNTGLINSTLSVFGSLSLPARIVTTDYTPTADDFTIFCDLQNDLANKITITLPSASSCNGRIYRFVGRRLRRIGDDDIETYIQNTSKNGYVRINGITLDPGYIPCLFRSSYTTPILANTYNQDKTSITVQSVDGLWLVIDDATYFYTN